jgi:hypothetical protein
MGLSPTMGRLLGHLLLMPAPVSLDHRVTDAGDSLAGGTGTARLIGEIGSCRTRRPMADRQRLGSRRWSGIPHAQRAASRARVMAARRASADSSESSTAT